MNNAGTRFILLGLSMTMFLACTIQKRHYRSGYYVNFRHLPERTELKCIENSPPYKKHPANCVNIIRHFPASIQTPSSHVKVGLEFKRNGLNNKSGPNSDHRTKIRCVGQAPDMIAPKHSNQGYKIKIPPLAQNNFSSGREVFADIGLVIGILFILGMAAAFIFDFIPVFALPMIIVDEVIMIISKSKWKKNDHMYTNKGAYIIAMILLVLSVIVGLFSLLYFVEFSI